MEWIGQLAFPFCVAGVSQYQRGQEREDEILSPTWLACFPLSLAGDFLLGIIVTTMGQSSVQQQIRVLQDNVLSKRHHGL